MTNHFECGHHGRDGVHDGGQHTGANVLEVALQRRQELDVVLRLLVQLSQLRQLLLRMGWMDKIVNISSKRRIEVKQKKNENGEWLED